MRMTFMMAATSGLLIGLLISSSSTPRIARSQESETAVSKDLDTLKASAKQFEAAFNKGDAAAIAAQFMENAEVVDEDGNVVQGRDKIQARFADIFKDTPKAKINVELTSLRQLSPDVAVEDGISVVRLNPEDPASRSPYTLVHLKRNGKWLIASIRDFPEESNDSAHEQLQQLAWLVGDWVDQSGDSRVETSCKWDEDGNYLIQEYVVTLREGSEFRGSQRIGWDPQRKAIRSWAFDRSGGYVESTWTPVDGSWVIKADGYAADGRPVSATRIATPLSPDVYQLDSTQRLAGQELLPDATVRVARRPPPPTAP